MYAKIFAQIYDGTLCTNHPWEALVTFQQFLILADQEGTVDMTARAISRRTGIPIEIIDKGIAELLLPDPESRTQDEEGRRLVPLVEGRDWGWRVVNYTIYRSLKREDDRREYHRQYWAEKRSPKAKTQQTQHELNTTQPPQPNQPIAEAEAEAEAYTKTGKPKSVGATASRLPADWQPSDAEIEFCKTERPDIDLMKTAAKFKDYYLSASGQVARKVNWTAAWRNWVRGEKSGQQQVNGYKSEKQRNSEATMRAIYGTPIQQTEKLIQGEIV